MTFITERPTYVPGRRRDVVMQETGLGRIHKLASNENPLGASPMAVAAMNDLLGDIAEYPDMAALAARTAIARHHGVSNESVIVGAGSDEVLMLAACATLDRDKIAIVLEPTFPQYQQHSRARGATLETVPLTNPEQIEEDILRKAAGRTGVVWLANPNNPTGTFIETPVLRRLVDRLGGDWTVVIDEAYIDYHSIDNSSAIDLARMYENVLVTRTFSKIYGLAGIRIGYGVGATSLIGRLNAYRAPFNTSALAQRAALVALGDVAHYTASRHVNTQGRERMIQFCHRHDVKFYPTEASFILLKSPIDEFRFAARLERSGYIIRPGQHLGAPGMARITIGTPDQMDGLLDSLEEIWSDER